MARVRVAFRPKNSKKRTIRMKRRRNGGRGRRVRRRTNNGALRGSVIRTKHVYLWSDMSGTSGKWYKQFTIAELTASFHSSFDEFKILSIKCVYRPNNAATETGLYVGVLLDQGGFGAYGGATETSWFRSLATSPGSKISSRHASSTFSWRPTEPSSREWYRYQTDSSHPIATLYIADNGKETAELGGVMELFIVMSVRGLYYNATVTHVRELTLEASRVSQTPTSPGYDPGDSPANSSFVMGFSNSCDVAGAAPSP